MQSTNRESRGQNREESHPPRSSWKKGRSSLKRLSSKTWSSTCLLGTYRSLRGEVRRCSGVVRSCSDITVMLFDDIQTAWKHFLWSDVCRGKQKMLSRWGLCACVSNLLEDECKAIHYSNGLIPVWYHRPEPSHFSCISQDWTIIVFYSEDPHSCHLTHK